MKKNSLRGKIFVYLIFFSVFILVFLWLFQVAFIHKYYEWTKTRDIKKITNTLLNTTTNQSLYDTLEKISYQENVCIEITTGDESIYASTSGRGCFFEKSSAKQFFLKSGEKEATYKLENPRFKDKSILQAVKLKNNLYAFVSTSLEPIDSTVKILQEQLIIVSIVVLALSFVIAYFIARYLAKPIVKISKAARLIAEGKLNTTFESERDILELSELADALNDMKKELARTEELERDLLANVSHDLKTPLTMIKAYAEMVRDLTYQDQEKRNANLNVILEEVDRLTSLVNDILELSKMQQDINTLEKEVFDFYPFVKDILKRFTIYEEKEGYIFKFIHPNLKQMWIKADRKKLEQVLYNLVINALNYTGEDKTIQVRIQEEKERFRIEVKDSGNGIRPADLPHIFEKYYKDQKKHQRNRYGTGLGLSIVKNVFLLHNYEYGVDSKKGQGSTFYFYIPKDR